MRRSLQLAASASMALLFAVPAFSQSVDEIVAKNLQAKGGADLLRQTTSVKMTGTFKTFQPTEMVMPMTTWAKRPNLVRREARVTPPAGQMPPGMPPGPITMINASDGTTVWIQQGATPPRALPAAQATEAIRDTEFDSVFIDYKAKGITIELVGRAQLNGKPMYHLSVKKANAPVQHYWLDTETGLEAMISTEVSQGGSTAKVETELSDYRAVEGRMVPFKTRQSVGGQAAAEMTVERVEFNVPMEDTLFKLPKQG